MFHENFGWMLNFWNITGVPFLYCFQSFYILKNQESLSQSLSVGFISFVYCLLLLGYYCFDSANCQKATDKMNGLRRNTFPQVPWGYLEKPIRYIETPKGNLLVDGWYAHVRKLVRC
jgi:delta24(24(1))-sterol reductase